MKLKKCECSTWADTRPEIRALTGHHENCNRRGDLSKAYLLLIERLVRGMERWALDEDGIHTEVWEVYKKAKCVLGEFDWKE